MLERRENLLISVAPSGRLAAFERPGGATVVELINSRKTEASVRLEWRGKSLRQVLPAHSITTIEWDQS